MSLNNKRKLSENAKYLCRELRRNSTIAERKLWEAIRGKRLCGRKFRRQYPIFHDLTGRETFFIADYYCYKEKLIIEIDGKYHLYKLRGDRERTKILNYLGLRVIRFSNEAVLENLENVLERIKDNFCA